MKCIPIKNLVCDKLLYPRNKPDWVTVHKYAQAMKAGAYFPPITVTKRKGQYVVIDGWHRLGAYKENKKTKIPVRELRRFTDKDIFIEAIKQNIKHGRPLGIQERAEVILRLRDFKLKEPEIANLIFMTQDSMADFVLNRLTYSNAGKRIVLKAPLKNLAMTEVGDRIAEVQKLLGGNSQVNLLKQLITLIKNNWIDLRDENVRAELLQLFALIKDIIKKYGLKLAKKNQGKIKQYVICHERSRRCGDRRCINVPCNHRKKHIKVKVCEGGWCGVMKYFGHECVPYKKDKK